MGFSRDAIGFYLEADDASLGSTLDMAAGKYKKFVGNIETWNERVYQATTKGLGKVSDLVEQFNEMVGATTRMAGKSKPIQMIVDFDTRGLARFRKVIGETVVKAMTDAKVRMRASMPQQRFQLFDTVNLRGKYKDQVQPPDMLGRLRPKKFNTGGVVDGPGGVDQIPALLTKGEMVLSRDVTNRLMEMSLGGGSGRFEVPKELIDTLTEVENLGKGLEKLKGGLEKGLGGQRELDLYQKGYEELAGLTESLVSQHNDLAFTTKVRTTPAITEAVGSLEDLRMEGEKSKGTFRDLFQKVIGPARFLALDKGLENLQEGIRTLNAKAGDAFTTLGGEAIPSGIENINRMNQFLGVSRDELLEIKVRAADTADALEGVTFDELTFGMAKAAELGIRNRDVMFDLARASAAAAKGTDIAADSAVALGFELTGSLGFSQQAFEDLLATQARLSSAQAGFNISAGKLFTQTANDVKALQSVMRDMDKNEAQNLLVSFNRMGAVLESQFIDAAPEIRQTLAQALEGGPANAEAMTQAALLTGKTMAELRTDLMRGDLEGLFDAIGQRVRGLDPQQIRALSEQVGIGSDQLVKFRDSTEAMNQGFERSKRFTVDAGEGLNELLTRAETNRTAFEQLQESFTDTVGAMSFMGIQGVEVLDFFKEFNLTTALSLGFLAKWGVQGIGGGIKLLGKFLPMLGKGKGLLGRLGGIAKLGGIAGIMGGVAGAGKGLLGGMFGMGRGAAAPRVAGGSAKAGGFLSGLIGRGGAGKGMGMLGKGLGAAGRFLGPIGLMITAAQITEALTAPDPANDVGLRIADEAGQQAAISRQQAMMEKNRKKLIADELSEMPAGMRSRVQSELDKFIQPNTSIGAVERKIREIVAMGEVEPPGLLQQTTTPTVTPSMIDSVVSSGAPPPPEDLGDKLDRNNELLEALLMEMRRGHQVAQGPPQPGNSVVVGPSRTGTDFSRNVASGQF